MEQTKLTMEEEPSLVSRVYLDLCEARGWWNVTIHNQADQSFISGHPNRHEPRQLVLPISSHQMVSPMQFQHYIHTIKLEDCKTEGLTLAICEPDTTTVYYKISDGLIQPESPEITDVKKCERYQIFQKRKADLDTSVQSYTNRLKRKQEEG
ncbi:uncharacterized protein [Mytilus edulis]|uniref:uncharacterized protein n=1 Tax=Mytilus edulis TaxID=6550 RepID=UPI0039EE39E1